MTQKCLNAVPCEVRHFLLIKLTEQLDFFISCEEKTTIIETIYSAEELLMAHLTQTVISERAENVISNSKM